MQMTKQKLIKLVEQGKVKDIKTIYGYRYRFDSIYDCTVTCYRYYGNQLHDMPACILIREIESVSN